MRPPEFTGGNPRFRLYSDRAASMRFNEAAGIHRRKPDGAPLGGQAHYALLQ